MLTLLSKCVCVAAKDIFRVDLATQLAITCSKLTMETLEQGVKYVQI